MVFHMNLDREWCRSEFIQHEILREHRPLEEEFNYYIAISEGNIDFVTENRCADVGHVDAELVRAARARF